MLDFSNEDAQKEFSNGPVPEGSIVMLEMEVLKPFEPAPDDEYIRETKPSDKSAGGLRQIYCKFSVVKGRYTGYSFRQNITLPLSAQTKQLTEGQQKACAIGGAQLKAICEASGKPLRAKGVTSLTGLQFPAKVKINQRKSPKGYWNNEIAMIITPDKPDFAKIKQDGEIITDGPVTGREDNSYGYGGYNDNGMNSEPMPNNYGADNVPF